MAIYGVSLTKRAKSGLKSLPKHIIRNFMRWLDLVEEDGLSEARKIPGFHDEPLKGARIGQRSIRLNQAYRAIYRTTKSGNIEI